VPRLLASLLALFALLAFATPAAAQSLLQPATVDDTVRALARDPVYVHPDADPTLTDAQADALRDRIAAQGAGPLYLAVLPDGVRSGAGGGER